MATVNLLSPATDFFDDSIINGTVTGTGWTVNSSSLVFSGQTPNYASLPILSFLGGSYGEAPGLFSTTITLTGSSHYVRLFVYSEDFLAAWTNTPIVYCADGVPSDINVNYLGLVDGAAAGGVFFAIIDEMSNNIITSSSYNLTVSKFNYGSGDYYSGTGPFWKDFVGCESIQ